jgi:predicted RNA-binding protein YlqC (UPF0109 family)
MKDLLAFLIKNILGSEDFTIEEQTEGYTSNLTVKTKKDHIGLIIGKEGHTIKNLRKILSVKGVLDKKSVNVSVTDLEG